MSTPPAIRVTEQALRNCADEPIAVPGAIQPHGVLLAVTEPDLEVVGASANAADLLGTEPAGRSVDDLLDAAPATALRAALDGDLREANPIRLSVAGAEVDVVLHRRDGLLISEWEPLTGAEQAPESWHRRLPLVLQRLAAAPTLDDLVTTLARDVRTVTGFDRVMIYRFDAEWNGEVVAEDRREDLEPFLGLHYPASDIPAQARDLYTRNWLRLIPDAGYRPVPLRPPVNPLTGGPLDLSGAMLRSVSPVHLEYLANMGVVASMSVSLIDGERLWGLISCHHYAGPHRPSYTDRTAAEFLGRTASLLLGTKVAQGEQEGVVAVAHRQAELVAALARSPRDAASALTADATTVLDLLPAGGAAVRLDGRLHLLGRTPPADRVLAVVGALLSGGSAVTDRLPRVLPEAADVADVASGVLAVGVGAHGDFLAWFRPETLREVSWGGDPYSPKVVADGGTARLSPRRSFARWSEIVRGTATPWRPHEVAAAGQLATEIGRVLLSRAEEDDRLAATLQRTLLLERLPAVPGVALAARYLPSAQDVVGGDWYDLVLLPSNRVALVLGDVAGHGLPAAAVTAQLRHALRAHLLRDLGPAGALQALNDLVTRLLPDEMATAVVAELDPGSGEVAIATAGHPPALHLGDGAGGYLDADRGPALGLLDEAGYRETRLHLDRGELLLLYSDGLIERRGADLRAGLAALRAAARPGGDAEAVAEQVLAALQPPADDDVTLVCLGRT